MKPKNPKATSTDSNPGKINNDLSSPPNSNPYGILKVEQPDEEGDEGISLPDVVAAIPQKQPKIVQSCELEESIENYLQYMTYCLYKDLNHLRDFLKAIWSAAARGDLDRLAAALTTHAAIELVRHTEEDLIANSQERFNRGNSYSFITSSVHQSIPLTSQALHWRADYPNGHRWMSTSSSPHISLYCSAQLSYSSTKNLLPAPGRLV